MRHRLPLPKAFAQSSGLMSYQLLEETPRPLFGEYVEGTGSLRGAGEARFSFWSKLPETAGEELIDFVATEFPDGR